MPRYKFQWLNIPEAVLTALTADEPESSLEAPELLRSRYGGRPDQEFIRANWETLREDWLAQDATTRGEVVEQLWHLGVGEGTEFPESRAAQMDFLRSCRNARRLREVVLGSFIGLGEEGPAQERGDDLSKSPPRLTKEVVSQQTPPSGSTVPARLGGDAAAKGHVGASSQPTAPPGPRSQTKEVQRAELHKTIWRIANDLRGSVDGWDFKSYVLGMLFYRFISENLTAYLNRQELAAGDATFDYAKLSDNTAEFGRKETVTEKGFYILPSELFVNVRKRAPSDENLNETLERVFRNIEGSAVGADSEDDLKGLFDDLEVNSAKLGPTVSKRNEKLVKLLDAIGDLDLGSEFTEHTIDAFGDAYEYLMTMYASGAGKSGGEFFTPQEVSELLARITVVGKKAVNKVYDPACGSGSLLLKFAKVLGKDNVRLGFFGQEVNLTTYNLARINMFLHDINYEKFDRIYLAHNARVGKSQ